jgi:hypothetical protein
MNSRNVVGTITGVFILVDLTVLHAASRLRQLSFHRLAARLLMTALSVLVLQHTGLAEDKSVCPIAPNLNPASHSDTLVVPEYASGRPLIANDYIVIEYNAGANVGSWSDYRHVLDSRGLEERTYPLNELDSFLPVLYTKEKVAVRICGFHFADVVSVTTAVNGLPENVADIRGVAPVTPPAALSTTFDTLQSGVPTGSTTTLPGLGLGAPAALPSLSISGITPGAMGGEDQTPGKYPSYTPVTVSASGKQVALLLYSVARNAKEVSRLIDRTLGEPYPTGNNIPDEATKQKILYEAMKSIKIPDDKTKAKILDEAMSAPGSVKGVKYSLDLALGQVRKEDSNPANNVAFDKDMIRIQNINAQITTLASALSSQAFASNALTLVNNYSALTGILDLAKLGVAQTNCQKYMPAIQPANLSTLSNDDLNKLKLSDFASWTASQLVQLSPTQIGWITDSTLKGQISSIQKALSNAGVTATNAAGDQPLCSVFEKQKLTDFWNSYTGQIGLIIATMKPGDLVCQAVNPGDPEVVVTGPDDFEGFAGCELTQLNDHIDTLRGELRAIDRSTTELYDRMNDWNRISSIEHTDVLLPLPQNSDVKVSIVVQPGYTPFTLANANGTMTPAVTANTVPIAPGTASTSTPAHARRIIHLQVHRLANFNLVGGAMLIHIPTASFGVQASPSYAVASTSSPTGYTGTCGGQTVNVPVSPTQSATTPVSYSCILQTQQTQWQVAGMAGLTWFPLGHDYYPRRLGYVNFGRDLLPSLLLATSVTSLGNSMGGINWEPIGGLDFYAGIASAHKTVLPSGLSVNAAAVPGTTVTPVTQEHVGFTIGVGFDLNSITALFKSSPASLP